MADPAPTVRPARGGPIPRVLLGGIALVALLVGIGIGWLLSSPRDESGGSDDLAAMCAALAVPTAERPSDAPTGDATDPAVYRASAISNLALAAAREDPDVDPVVEEVGAQMRIHLSQRQFDLLADDLAALEATC